MPPEQDVAEVQEVVATEAAESAESTQSEQPEQEPEQTPEKPQKTFTEEELNRKIQKRLDRAQRSFERKMNEALEAERQRYAQQSAPRETSPTAPKLEQFDNLDDYVAAKAEWVADQKLTKAFAEREQQEKQRAEQGRRGEVEKTWHAKVNQFRTEAPDFDEVIGSADVQLNETMASALMESDMGPKVAYYLARHPDEAEDMQYMTPQQVYRTIGKIEAKLENEALVKKQSSAPKPASPVGARTSVSGGPNDKQSVDDWLRARNAQLKARNS